MKSNLGERLQKAAPYIIATMLIFFALPYIAAYIEMTVAPGAGLLFLTPIIDCCAAMAIGYFYGKKNGRDPIMPLASFLAFLLCMVFVFDASFWICLIVAPLFSYLGECFGYLRGRYDGRI